MNGRERILAHLAQKPVDRIPLMPVTMQYAGDQIGATYHDYVTDHRVLVDAPCSNTGVMRRRLDVRWRLTEDEIRNITEQQAGILQKASTYLKPGGKIVYSTCSLEADENVEIVQQFLNDNPTFEAGDQQQLAPFEHGVDGAFVAVLRKTQE